MTDLIAYQYYRDFAINKRAFKVSEIRSTVVLTITNKFTFKINFMFKGGELDLNGNRLDNNPNFTGSIYSFIERNINLNTLLNNQTSGVKFHDINTFYSGNIYLNKDSNLGINYAQIEFQFS